MSQQYASRTLRSISLVNGSPDYEPVKSFESAASSFNRDYKYSPDGRLYAYITPACVYIHYAENAELLRELPLPNIVDVSFSPRGTYISTWERIVKLENDEQHKNLRVFSVSSGDELISFTQKTNTGWELQFTISESHAIRLVGQELQVFHPAEWSKGVVDKLKVEGVTTISLSPGLNPSVAVFVAGKNGQPANIRIYSLLALSKVPTCQKATFRAEHAQFKWNTIGTQVLALVRTDVDQTNKSYYGETRLYLLSSAGNFDCHVAPPKEGPIHDFAWSPNSKEFGVVCGFTPTKTVLYDSRVKVLYDFGTAPQNFIAFNPQARLIALAGFGNMSGKINVYDRRTFEKITTVDAPNTTFFEWSPCGRFMLTATLSPRLRVDNCVKIWYCTGQLLHVQLLDELYQASWRPIPVDSVGPFPQVIPPAPMANASVALFIAGSKPVPAKPVGAYRPPGARGSDASSIYQRGDSEPGSGTTTPARPYNRSPGPGANGYGSQSGRGRGRYVPGAPTSPPTSSREGGQGGQGGNKKVRTKRKQEANGKKEENVAPVNGGNGAATADASAEQAPDASAATNVNGDLVVDGSTLDPVSKKIRNLKKKLKAIDDLVERKEKGERLEDTQFKKIDAKESIVKELEKLELQSASAAVA